MDDFTKDLAEAEQLLRRVQGILRRHEENLSGLPKTVLVSALTNLNTVDNQLFSLAEDHDSKRAVAIREGWIGDKYVGPVAAAAPWIGDR